MTNAQRQAISSPAAGLQVFVTDFEGGRFMFYDGTEWGTLSFTEKRPDAPTIGTASAGITVATVPFTAPSSDGGSAITSYTATSSPGGITGTLSQAGSGSITVTGLTNGTAYTFTVTATNAIGTSLASAASSSVTPLDAPSSPTITGVASGDAQATVSFTAPSSDGGSAITSYTATSNPGGITGTLSQAGSGSITVTGLTNGTAYTFSVTATNAVGTSLASAVSNSVVPATIPDAPTIGTATAVIGEATVPFTAPSSNGGSAITSYTATSSPGGITGTISQSGSGSIIVSGLTSGTAYTFTVTATNAMGTSLASAVSNSVVIPQPLAIGDTYQGGIIFYLDGNGGGLIAADSDQYSAQWGCYEQSIAGTSSAVGTGAANTTAILSGCSEIYIGGWFCADLTLGGYTDWFLPSKDELNLMYDNIGPGDELGLGNVGDFDNDYYWSSTETAGSFAWAQNFAGGYQGGLYKINTFSVRAVRAF